MGYVITPAGVALEYNYLTRETTVISWTMPYDVKSQYHPYYNGYNDPNLAASLGDVTFNNYATSGYGG